jgi:hypothetical protein
MTTMTIRSRARIQKNQAGATGDAGTGGAEGAQTTDTTKPAESVSPEGQKNPVDLAALEARVAQLEAANEAGIEKEMTEEEFGAYVEAQLDEAGKEPTEKSAPRLKALKSAIVTAKAAFAGGSSVKITVFKAPDVPTVIIPAKEAQPSSGTSNVSFNAAEMNVVAKRAHALAKHLTDDKSEVRTTLAKSAEGKTVIAKAGEAAKMLDGIAQLFGVSATNCEGEYYGLGWRVSDIIRAVEDAARVENAMQALASALGGTAAPAPAEPVEQAAGGMPAGGAAATEEDEFAPGKPAPAPAAKSQTQKSADKGDDNLFEIQKNEEGWPMDMSASVAAKRVVNKSEKPEITF